MLLNHFNDKEFNPVVLSIEVKSDILMGDRSYNNEGGYDVRNEKT